MELAKRENRRSLYKVVDKSKRRDWVTQRMKSIVRDMRQLETAIRGAGKDKLFGENSFPEAEKFASIIPASSEMEFESFFNICNRCFVESIENYGKSIGKPNYFWNEIKNTYPSLHAVLHRIKVYRHSQDHLSLHPDVAQKYRKFWDEDTKGISDSDEQRFAIQQKTLENLLTAVQLEIAAIT